MYSPDKPIIKYRKNYKPSQYIIKKTRLNFELYDSHVLVFATLLIERNPQDELAQLGPLILDGIELELLEISLDEEKLSNTDYEVNASQLIINQPKEKFYLFTKLKLFPNKNSSLEGLYTSAGKFCTQCEAEGFRKITYYLDRPEIMSEFFVRVEGNKSDYPLLLSNGNPVEKGDLKDNRHYVCWHDPFPKPSYLFALVAGDLDCLEDHFTTQSGRKIKLQLFVDKGKLEQCRFAMESLKKSMFWDEKNYSREYDLDLYMIVAVGDFNMGAMENKGLNVFNTAYVFAHPKTATDSDFEGVERVIAHEYFHNWTGNRITCRDWFQLSLKEGLTVFRDQKFSEDMQSADVQRIDQVKIIRSAQFMEDSGPMAHPIRPDSYIEMNNFYTVTIYNKGAEVIRMMNTLLGKVGFHKGMDLYFERHDGQAVTCEDFVKAMEDANQIDWSLFRNWYRQAGTPKLQVEMETGQNNREAKLKFYQSCPPTPGQDHKDPFMIPVKIGFIDNNGRSVKFRLNGDRTWLEESLLVIKEKTECFDFQFDNLKTNLSALIPSLLRGFSAPVKLKYNYSQSELSLLFAYDTDTFNRWNAGQKLMSGLLISNKRDISDNDLQRLSDAVKNTLLQSNLDNAIKALAVQLPNLNSLIGQATSIDLDKLFSKYRQLKLYIAKSLRREWLSIYECLQSTKKDTENAGDRSLKNTALNYLMIASENEYADIAVKQQNNADNMTDELGALKTIANSKIIAKQPQIDSFYKKWKDEDLLVDKWFSAQVTLDDEAIILQVKNLLAHEKFSINNPNKVRSVISAFIAGNTMQFHNSTGQGYELLANTIIRLNSINPQIGARLATHFGQWRKFDLKRQALIKEQLERIVNINDLSSDIYEVVNKSIQALPCQDGKIN